jgi:hypothetical protein
MFSIGVDHIRAYLSNNEYAPLTGLPDPDSSLWFLLQCLSILSSAVAGVAAARWSRPDTWAAPLTLAAGYVALDFISMPDLPSVFHSLAWLLGTPLGILGGAFLQRRSEHSPPPSTGEAL